MLELLSQSGDVTIVHATMAGTVVAQDQPVQFDSGLCEACEATKQSQRGMFQSSM